MAGIWGTVAVGHALALCLAIRAVAASTLTLKRVFLPALTGAILLSIAALGCWTHYAFSCCCSRSGRAARAARGGRGRRAGGTPSTPSWTSPATPMSADAVTPLARSFADLLASLPPVPASVPASPFSSGTPGARTASEATALLEGGGAGRSPAPGQPGGDASPLPPPSPTHGRGGESGTATPLASYGLAGAASRAGASQSATGAAAGASAGTLSRRSRHNSGATGATASSPREGMLVFAGAALPGTPLARATAEAAARPSGWEYLVLSALLAWATLMTIVASAWTDPTVLCLLASWQVPSTLVWATTFFGSTYSPVHSVGALLVAAGCTALSVFTSARAEVPSLRWGAVVALVAASLTSLGAVLLDRAAWRGANRPLSMAVSTTLAALLLYAHSWLFEQVELPDAFAMLTVDNEAGDQARVAVASVAIAGALVIWTQGMAGRKISSSVTFLAKPASAAWALATRLGRRDVYPASEMVAIGATLAVCSVGAVAFVTSRGGAGGLPSAEAIEVHAALELARSARTAESAEEDWDSVGEDDLYDAAPDAEDAAERQLGGAAAAAAGSTTGARGARRGDYAAVRTADDDANAKVDRDAYARAKRRSGRNGAAGVAAPASAGRAAGAGDRAAGRAREDLPTSYDGILDEAFAEEDEGEEDASSRRRPSAAASKARKAERRSGKAAAATDHRRSAPERERALAASLAPEPRSARDRAHGLRSAEKVHRSSGSSAAGPRAERQGRSGTTHGARVHLVSRSEAKKHDEATIESREELDAEEARRARREELDAEEARRARRERRERRGRERDAASEAYAEEEEEDYDEEDDTEVYDDSSDADDRARSESEPSPAAPTAKADKRRPSAARAKPGKASGGKGLLSLGWFGRSAGTSSEKPHESGGGEDRDRKAVGNSTSRAPKHKGKASEGDVRRRSKKTSSHRRHADEDEEEIELQAVSAAKQSERSARRARERAEEPKVARLDSGRSELSIDDRRSNRGGLTLDDRRSSRGGLTLDDRRSSRGGLTLDDRRSSRGGLTLDDRRSSRGSLTQDDSRASWGGLSSSRPSARDYAIESLESSRREVRRSVVESEHVSAHTKHARRTRHDESHSDESGESEPEATRPTRPASIPASTAHVTSATPVGRPRRLVAAAEDSTAAAHARLGAPKSASASDRFRRSTKAAASAPEEGAAPAAAESSPARRSAKAAPPTEQAEETSQSPGHGRPRLVARTARTALQPVAGAQKAPPGALGIWRLGKPVASRHEESDESPSAAKAADRHAGLAAPAAATHSPLRASTASAPARSAPVAGTRVASVHPTPVATARTAATHPLPVATVRTAASTATPVRTAATASLLASGSAAARETVPVATTGAAPRSATTAPAPALARSSAARASTAAAGNSGIASRPRLLQARTTAADPMGPGFRITRRSDA